MRCIQKIRDINESVLELEAGGSEGPDAVSGVRVPCTIFFTVPACFRIRTNLQVDDYRRSGNKEGLDKKPEKYEIKAGGEN